MIRKLLSRLLSWDGFALHVGRELEKERRVLMEERMKLLPCPFCGETPDVDKRETFTMESQPKWASVICCITGPEIRTGYEKWPAWKADAIAAWNTRAPLPEPPR